MLHFKGVLLIMACIMMTLTSFETRKDSSEGGGGSWRHRKVKPLVGDFLYDRYQRYLKMNRCKMDIRYSTRYNSYFWNRIQVPDNLEMNIFVLPSCKVNGVQMNHCHFAATNLLQHDGTAKFMVNVRELSAKLTQYSILQDIQGLLTDNVYNFTINSGMNIAQARQMITKTKPVLQQVAHRCLEHYTKKKTLGDVLTEKQRKKMTFNHCLKPSG